jgi:uncharacterized protein involved in response to NO
LALALFVINAIRLIGWHTSGIWKKSLLWSLYLSFWFICFGFLLFAVGGVGVVTMSMMSRVTLGHTGRDISKTPKAISYVLGILLFSAIIRYTKLCGLDWTITGALDNFFFDIYNYIFPCSCNLGLMAN